MKQFKRIIIVMSSVAIITGTGSALAHVTVRPSQAGIGSFQTFTVSVPSERDLATVSLRLSLPDGLQNITPTVKSGWNVEVK